MRNFENIPEEKEYLSFGLRIKSWQTDLLLKGCEKQTFILIQATIEKNNIKFEELNDVG